MLFYCWLGSGVPGRFGCVDCGRASHLYLSCHEDIDWADEAVEIVVRAALVESRDADHDPAPWIAAKFRLSQRTVV